MSKVKCSNITEYTTPPFNYLFIVWLQPITQGLIAKAWHKHTRTYTQRHGSLQTVYGIVKSSPDPTLNSRNCEAGTPLMRPCWEQRNASMGRGALAVVPSAACTKILLFDAWCWEDDLFEVVLSFTVDGRGRWHVLCWIKTTHSVFRRSTIEYKQWLSYWYMVHYS